VGAVIHLDKSPLFEQLLNYYDDLFDWVMLCN